jgi:hypothetical protein
MSDVESPPTKSPLTGATSFSKIPVIRKLETLLSDEEFESAGFKIARHPLKDVCFVLPGSDFIQADEDDISSNRLTARYALLHRFDFPATKETSTSRDLGQDFKPVIARLSELRELATEEGTSFSKISAEHAIKWLRTASPPVLPSVFVLNNGNVRYLWKRNDTQLGIQFLEDETVQFVFLGADDQTERIFGSLRATELLKRISGLDLLEVLGF